MKISLNSIKNYLKQPLIHNGELIQDSELIDLIGSRLVEVESVTDLSLKYQNIYIVKVVDCQPIPDTHLSLCQIDAGDQNSQFSTLDNGLIQVVCGAPNVHTGMWAVWLAPGSIVPSTYQKDNFKLSVRKLKGYESHGMLGSVAELDLGTDHQGIIELDPNSNYSPGQDFAASFGLNDLILDIENKSLTHRPDTFGLIGFAREVAGILGQEFASPELFTKHHLDLHPGNITIKIDDHILCPRYSCAVFDYSETSSPYLTSDQVFLAKAGLRSISPIVDLTNLIMLETGQPLHAFDYDKFLNVGQTDSPIIGIRAASAGETLTLIDQRTITCEENDILITSNNTPVALAGAMGGANTEIDQNTKRILLESATFSLYHLRKTQMKHGIFSEAITRFTKGQPAGLTFPVLAEAVSRLGVQPFAVADYFKEPQAFSVTTTFSKINAVLGTNYSPDLIIRTLTQVNFMIDSSTKDQLTVSAPYWRTDIKIEEDLIEEVGRLLGFDRIPLTLPQRSFKKAKIDPLISLKTELRQLLSGSLGAHEVLTYSFISQNLLTAVNQDPNNSYKIVNSLSPELQYFRQQLSPSLLEKIRPNLRSGHQNFTIYEFNQVVSRNLGLNSESVPNIKHHLALVTLGDYYKAKAYLIKLANNLRINLEFKSFSSSVSYLEPLHSATLYLDNRPVGFIGEVNYRTLRSFKLDTPVALFEIDLETLLSAPRIKRSNFALSRFPSVDRDLTVKVSETVNYLEVFQALSSALDPAGFSFKVTPLSIYQPSGANWRNLSFRLSFASLDHTLTNQEISDIMETIKNTLIRNFSAEII